MPTLTPALTPAPVRPGENLAPARLRRWLEADDAPRVLDVRSPAEFETVHIPGSFNVPLGLPNVHVLDGGVSAWEAEGAPVQRGVARWALERQVRLVAGGIVLAAGLGSVVVPGLRWVATGVGAGLVTAALTDTCAMGAALSKLPYNRGPASCDVDAVVAELAGTSTSAR